MIGHPAMKTGIPNAAFAQLQDRTNNMEDDVGGKVGEHGRFQTALPI
jgi:hypothetical protein